MGMRAHSVSVIKVRRELVMVVMIYCQLVGRGHMEIVISGCIRAHDRHKKHLRAEKVKREVAFNAMHFQILAQLD